jgi:queuine tRNA-ribosyltransferase
MSYRVIHRDVNSSARTGRITTPHGSVDTPVFMPVGTQGTVKAMFPHQLAEMGAEILLGNTYHLHLRPGSELIHSSGGLHSFMSWNGAILTDSGGFQIFSLKDISGVDEDGVTFQSHVDGSKHFISPEKSIEIQTNLGSDIMMVLDHLTPADASTSLVESALERTTRWAKRCLDYKKSTNRPDYNLFAIQQGGFDEAFRKRSAEELCALPFDGFAVGGLSVGEEKNLMYSTAACSVDLLPADKPKYIMGVGTPEDLLTFVEMGYDMFDCVLPTRTARTGKLFTSRGTLNIKNSRYKDDKANLDADCNCYTCMNFSRAYLRHLFLSKEILGIMLNTLHNLDFYLKLMRSAREAINADRFVDFKNDFLNKFQAEVH